MNLDELEAVARAATPGKRAIWNDGVYIGNDIKKGAGFIRDYERKLCELDDLDGTAKQQKADARFTVKFTPERALALLAVVRAAQAYTYWLDKPLTVPTAVGALARVTQATHGDEKRAALAALRQALAALEAKP